MSNLKSGRPCKISKFQNRRKNYCNEFDFERFSDTLKAVSGDPKTWSFKPEWMIFSERYFESEHVTRRHAKAAYLFFKKHETKLNSSCLNDPISECLAGMREDVESKNILPASDVEMAIINNNYENIASVESNNFNDDEKLKENKENDSKCAFYKA